MGIFSGITDSLGGLLGGSGSSGASTVWGGQKPYLTDLYQRAQDTSYGGQGQAYAEQYQQPTFSAFNNLAQGGQAMDMNPLNALAQGGQFNQYMNQQNPALNNAIDSGLDQIGRNFNRNIMPSINTGAALAGTSGGSRQGIAQGIAASDANQQATDFVNQMQSQNFNQIQNRGLQATQAGVQNQLGAYGQLNQNASLANQSQATALGAAPSVSNLGFGSQYGDLQQLGSLIGGPTVLGGGSQQTGGIGSSLGGMAQMGALGYLAFSDERVKDDIQKVGKLDNGLNVYSYKYKGEDKTQIGVMAQEVEKVKPEAVIEIGGVKRVDYKKAVAELSQPVLGE